MNIKIRYEYGYLGGNGWHFKQFFENEIDHILQNYLNNIDIESFCIVADFYDGDICIGSRELYNGYGGYTNDYKINNCFHPIPQCQHICEKIKKYLKNT